MKWLDDLQTFLSGKKTIITAVMAGVDLMGSQLGWWEEGRIRNIFEGVLLVIFARLGVEKSAPAVKP